MDLQGNLTSGSQDKLHNNLLPFSKNFMLHLDQQKAKSFEKESFLADSVSKPKPGKLKGIRKEIETTLASAKTSNTPFLAHQVSKKVKRSKNEKKRHRKDDESESQRKKIKV
ncbi:hypothetical protein HAX54_025560 [Datura stramonium]|uniref:Uncharacterized protein n=1 Tax=Datura stramonium TaxID=4076 RepID=A0ABS8S6C0_DATST|nr:hypothetical protein [Datura stramonium]